MQNNPLKLLIVEDDTVLRSRLVKSFQKRQFHVEATQALSSTQVVVERTVFDYALLDLKLLNESSLSLIPQLKQNNTKIKIVMMTGYASIATAVEAIKLGATDYLPKPITIEDILKAFDDEELKVEEKILERDPMSVKRLEWEHIQKILAENNGNISETARQLNMHRRTLQRKLQKKPSSK
ncbi:MAG: response regulator [Pseudomonadota bacterium]